HLHQSEGRGRRVAARGGHVGGRRVERRLVLGDRLERRGPGGRGAGAGDGRGDPPVGADTGRRRPPRRGRGRGAGRAEAYGRAEGGGEVAPGGLRRRLGGGRPGGEAPQDLGDAGFDGGDPVHDTTHRRPARPPEG